ATLLVLVLLAGWVGNASPAQRPSPSELDAEASREVAPQVAAPATTAPEPPQLVPGQVVVILHESERLHTFPDRRVGRDLRLLDPLPELRAAVLGVPEGQENAQIAALSADARVLVAERNALLSEMMVPDDPIYKEFQWDLRKIGMEAVWEVTTGSPN